MLDKTITCLGSPLMTEYARVLRAKGFACLGNAIGVYCWWFDETAYKKLLGNASGIDCSRLITATYKGKEYYALYFGQAKKKTLAARLKWHICQKHTPSAVKSGALSTLRQTISALLGIDEAKSESAVNQLMDDHCLVECWSIGLAKIDAVEHQVINQGYFPLNIQSNKSVSSEWKKFLKSRRKDVKK